MKKTQNIDIHSIAQLVTAVSTSKNWRHSAEGQTGNDWGTGESRRIQ